MRKITQNLKPVKFNRSVLYLSIRQQINFVLPILMVLFLSAKAVKPTHPYYLSVIEIEHSAKEEELQIACKIFSDDLEETLQGAFKQKVNMLKADEKKKTSELLAAYLQKHLRIQADGVVLKPEFLGFENELEATWSYLVVKNIKKIKQATITCDLLYDYKPEQINIFHFKVNGERKSHRLTPPSTQFTLSW